MCTTSTMSPLVTLLLATALSTKMLAMAQYGGHSQGHCSVVPSVSQPNIMFALKVK